MATPRRRTSAQRIATRSWKSRWHVALLSLILVRGILTTTMDDDDNDDDGGQDATTMRRRRGVRVSEEGRIVVPTTTTKTTIIDDAIGIDGPREISSGTSKRSSSSSSSSSSFSSSRRRWEILGDVLRNEEDGGTVAEYDDRRAERHREQRAMMDDGNRTSVVGPELRIINGEMAPETRYPYSTSLQYDSQHFCGGALVAPNIAVTAAHCTTTGTITGVVLGRYDLDSMTDYDYETMAVIDVVLHPGWDPIIVSNDVALLILERNSRHPYVTINRDWDVPTQGEHLVVMGWGDIDPHSINQQTSDKLRETDVIYLSNDVCDMSQGYANTPQGYQFLSYEDLIGDNMLCAFGGLSATVSDACQGDSGGPLVKTGSDSAADLLVGLVSWGFSCADSNFPGVYSRMSAFFVDFLRPGICEYSSSPPSYLECYGSDAGGLVVPTPSPVSTDSAYDEFIPTPIPASTNLVFDELTPAPSPVLTHSVFVETAPVDSTWQPTDSQTLAGDPPIYNQPASASASAPSPVQISSPDTSFPAHNGEDYAFTFTPVTGSITCKRGGMACTITCSNCASIKRVALGMNMEWPNESTIIYTTERGTDEYPDDPSLLIVVGTETTSANEISCDVGCTCSSVNDRVLGCGLVAHSNLGPPLTIPDALNCSVHIGMSRCLMTCMLVLLLNLT